MCKSCRRARRPNEPQHLGARKALCVSQTEAQASRGVCPLRDTLLLLLLHHHLLVDTHTRRGVQRLLGSGEAAVNDWRALTANERLARPHGAFGSLRPVERAALVGRRSFSRRLRLRHRLVRRLEALPLHGSQLRCSRMPHWSFVSPPISLMLLDELCVQVHGEAGPGGYSSPRSPRTRSTQARTRSTRPDRRAQEIDANSECSDNAADGLQNWVNLTKLAINLS